MALVSPLSRRRSSDPLLRLVVHRRRSPALIALITWLPFLLRALRDPCPTPAAPSTTCPPTARS